MESREIFQPPPIAGQAAEGAKYRKEAQCQSVIWVGKENSPFAGKNKIPHVFIDNQLFSIEKFPIFAPFLPTAEVMVGVVSTAFRGQHDLQA